MNNTEQDPLAATKRLAERIMLAEPNLTKEQAEAKAAKVAHKYHRNQKK